MEEIGLMEEIDLIENKIKEKVEKILKKEEITYEDYKILNDRKSKIEFLKTDGERKQQMEMITKMLMAK